MDGDIEWGGCLSRMKGIGKASTGDSCMAGKTEDRKMKDRGRWSMSTEENQIEVR